MALAYSQKHQDPHELGLAEIEEDQNISDDDSVSPRDLVRSSGKPKLQQKFLTRLAEVFARQKQDLKAAGRYKQKGDSSDAAHVSATILCFEKGLPVVYLAKNAGITEDDRQLLSSLQCWLRETAVCGEQRVPETDTLWTRLIDFNKSRLQFYVSRLATSGVAKKSTSQEAWGLLALCKKYGPEIASCQADLSTIVLLAYRLRYTADTHGLPPKHVRTIILLGRLRATWETFDEFALHDIRCGQIELRSVSENRASVSRADLEAGLQKLSLSTGELERLTATVNTPRLDLYTHAEMQLLLHYGSVESASSQPVTVPYMGSSKRTCWHCEEALRRHGYFTSRGSHGEVAPHWSISTASALEVQFTSRIADVLCAVQKCMVDKLQDPGRHRPAMVQTTASVTTTESRAILLKKSQRRELHLERNKDGMVVSWRPQLPERLFGEYVKTINAIRLPADSLHSTIVELNIDRVPASTPDEELSDELVPDFSPFKNMQRTNEVMCQRFTVQLDEFPETNDDYVLCFALHSDLPNNKCILNMLSIDETVDLEFDRHFWRGDVIVFRCTDGKDTFLSCPADARMDDVLRLYFQEAWNRQDLEHLVESERKHEEVDDRFRTELRSCL